MMGGEVSQPPPAWWSGSRPDAESVAVAEDGQEVSPWGVVVPPLASILYISFAALCHLLTDVNMPPC